MFRFAAALLLVCATPLAAQTGFARSAADYHARMDANGDGKVMLDEYQDFLSYGFRNLDRNGDGVVDKAELGALSGRQRAPITLAAHRAKLAKTFARQDANGDGYLDRVEIAAPPR